MARAAPGDCNDDEIPDDQFGQGLLFFDTFAAPVIDPQKWSFVQSATIDAMALNEPTPPYALRLNGNTYGADIVESIPIDLSHATWVTLQYAWQRAGGGEPPEVNDDLYVEFRAAAGNWIQIARHLGSGASMTEFAKAKFTLPAAAYHSTFELRFRNRATIGPYDDWFVDDVFLIDGVPDCNGNGVPDDCDINDGTSADCNGNGFPDECDLSLGISADCNGNGLPDECDLASGTSIDMNGDAIPDECQDCNENGTLDPLEIAEGTSADCNLNGIPDECDLATGLDSDCDGNGIPDACDIAPRAYRIDDGTYELFLGSKTGISIIWFNRFVVESGGEDIVGASVAWGESFVGSATTVAIWRDPDNDGDPSNAELLQTVSPVLISNPKTNRFTEVAIPRTRVGEAGDYFFVGVYMANPTIQQPLALDISSTPAHDSFVAIGDNLEDLEDNPYPPFPIEEYLQAGNFMIRAISANRDCNENGWFDACDIAARDSYDNNTNDLPDECEWGTEVGLELVPDADCYNTGDVVTIEIWLRDAEEPVVAGQFFLDYDPSRLELTEVDPADAPSPFTVQIYECSTREGEGMPQCQPSAGSLDYAVGIAPSASGMLGSERMATIQFVALRPICSAQGLLSWSADGLVRLGTEYNTPLYPLLIHPELGDAIPPLLEVPDNRVMEIDQSGVCAVAASIAADATDNCTDTNDLILTWRRSDGYLALTDPFHAVDSPVTIDWRAEDACGNSATGTTTVEVILSGDLDADLDVDLTDLAQLLANYGITSGATYAQGDLDHDGDVDLSDLAALLSVYGNLCP